MEKIWSAFYDRLNLIHIIEIEINIAAGSAIFHLLRI